MVSLKPIKLASSSSYQNIRHMCSKLPSGWNQDELTPVVSDLHIYIYMYVCIYIIIL